MRYALHKMVYSCSLLLILVTAMVGQKVHIYTEDPLHFAAFCRTLAPDNGADCQVVEQCVVDDFWFFPCICVEELAFETRFELLGRPADAVTNSRLKSNLRLAALRAPPAWV